MLYSCTKCESKWVRWGGWGWWHWKERVGEVEVEVEGGGWGWVTEYGVYVKILLSYIFYWFYVACSNIKHNIVEIIITIKKKHNRNKYSNIPNMNQ